MNINETLTKNNKAVFRKLLHKYHPDKKGGSEEITKKLTVAGKTDDAFEEFYYDLTGKALPGSKAKYDAYVKKQKKEAQWKKEAWSDIKKDMNKKRKKTMTVSDYWKSRDM